MTIMTHLKDLKDDFHSETVLSILNEQRIRGVLCDVTIIVEDTKFKAHSNVLAASSLYFKNIFWSRAICISGHVLELDDLKADVFTEILNYIYNSTVMVKRQDIVLDLAAAGKKLGISFLEDLTDKNFSNSPCLYSFCNTEKGEVKEEKRQEDSAITNGPRITNAYSIFETENCGNLFSPLDLRASFKKLPETNKASSVGPDRNGPCNDLERTSTLAEHSYAVTTGCDTFQQNSSYHINSPLCKTGQGDSDIGLSVPTVKAATQIFSTAKGICNSHTTDTTSVQVSTHKVANAEGHQKVVTDQMFLKKCHPNIENKNGKDENKSGQVSGSIAVVIPSVYNSKCRTNSFKDVAQCNTQLQFHSQPQEPLVCKYCSKQFESATRLEAHVDVCRGLDSCENEQNPSDTLVTANEKNSSSYINQEPMVTDNELTDYSATNCTMPETEHFVKVVDGQILYSCNVCRRTYVTLSSLRRHSNVHSWRRTYPCHYCNKVFALAEYRTRHEIWHTGERRYQCIFCLETFMTYYILKNHQKSFHAIDHQLGGNKKTANGGLKPSVYPYKLYRLLPMKCKRSPYKTYETSSYENIQASVQVNEAPSSTCTIQNTVASELPPLDFPSSMLPNTTISLDIPCSDPTLSPMNPTNVSSWEDGTSKTDTYTTEAQLSSTELHSGPHGYDSYLQNVSSSTTTENSTSVINYNSSAPSVIVHSGRVSSVIMHSNAVSTIGNTGIPEITVSQVATNDSTHFSDDSKSNARISSREKKKALSYNREETLEGLKHMGDTGLSSNTSTDMSSKTETYIAKPALPGTSADRNIAPLCQITVKIGNEAIVKRHILGSKIFYKKGRRSKHETKEDSTVQVTERETRERSVSQVSRSEYLELTEMCDDVSDHDSNDKPWRPYYNYKPKKKSKQLRKTRKAKWRERYNSRNSLRASEKTYVTSYALRKIPEEKIPNQEDECEMARLHCEEVPAEGGKQDHLHWDTTTSKIYVCQLCRKHFQSPSALRIHMQCHPGEKPYPCKTCGKSFSVSGNLQKHECTHSSVKDFICQYCNKAFSLKQTLKIHERIHTGEKRYHCQFCFQSFLYLSTKRNHERKHKCEQNGKGFACFQCPKVCKTAAALGMHQKKHLFKNPKQENKMDCLLNESTKSFESQYSVDPHGQKEHKPLLTQNVIDADGCGPSTTSIVGL